MTVSIAVLDRSSEERSASALRAEGLVPGIIYGPGREPRSISVAQSTLVKLLRDTTESTIITLSGLGEPLAVLIQDIAYDPVTSEPAHIDFYAVKSGEEVEVNVPLSFVQESPAVKEGGSLVKVLHELSIKALPDALPSDIEVDLTRLASLGDQILVSDLIVPAGVTVIDEPTQVVALVQESEKEEESSVPIDMGAIAVEKKGKTEDAAAA